MTYPLPTSARVAIAPFGVRLPLTCCSRRRRCLRGLRCLRHAYVCPLLLRTRKRPLRVCFCLFSIAQDSHPSRVEPHSFRPLHPSRRGSLPCALSETALHVAAFAPSSRQHLADKYVMAQSYTTV